MSGDMSVWRRLELPTWAVAVAIYGGWIGLTLSWAALPAWVSVPLMALLLAWHGSFQHETIHGHPTRSDWINGALGWPPLALWLPYPIYKATHLVHHRDDDLTIPAVDPESYYVPVQDWRAATGLRRAVLIFHHTLLGRLTIGPARALWRFYRAELSGLARGRHLGIWLRHLMLCGFVLLWMKEQGVPLWAYAVAVYLSISLTQVRSFGEHKAATDATGRTAIVETAWPMALLFLNNNLHARHHAAPGMPWFDLARFHRRAPAWTGLTYRGYGEILMRFLLSPVDRPVRFMDLAERPSAVAETLAEA